MPVKINNSLWIILLLGLGVGLLFAGTANGIYNSAFIANSDWEEVGSGSASGGGISNNSGDSGRPSVAADQAGNVYVAWHDDSSGKYQIYVRKWTGSQWAEVGTNSASGAGISNSGMDAKGVSLSTTSSGNPCAAWRDKSSGFSEIYLRCWNGSTWAEVGPGSASGGGVSNQKRDHPYDDKPALAIGSDDQIYVTWYSKDGENYEVYAKKWNGDNWISLGSDDGNVSNNSGRSVVPSLALMPGNTPFIAWEDDSSGNREIYVRRWNGSNWIETNPGSATEGGVSNSLDISRQASLAISPSGIPFLAWNDDKSGNDEIFVRRWNGSTWTEVGAGSATTTGISNNVGTSWRPHTAISSENLPCVSWQDNSGGNENIYVRCWTGSGWTEVGGQSATDGGVSDTSAKSIYPAIAIDKEGTHYAAWGDESSGNFEIYVRRYSKPQDNTPTPTPSSTNTNTPTATATSTKPPVPTSAPIVNLPIIMYQLPPTVTPSPTNTPTPTPTRAPLFVGLDSQWDGRGYVRTDEYFEPGYHLTSRFTSMIDNDIIKSENRDWYDPNPKGWASENWLSYYSVSTGSFLSSDYPSDSAWKWGSYRYLPYRFSFKDGDIFKIDGQDFRVHGPYNGVGAFGQRISFWRMVNKEKFLFFDGGNWKQYVHPGDITLEYDINTRLRLKRDVLRRLYYKGDLIPSYTIQYVDLLTRSNAYPLQQLRIEPIFPKQNAEYPAIVNPVDIPDYLTQSRP